MVDRSRIVGMSEQDLDEFTCGICQELFNDPVVTQCCRQTYCKSCIEEWLTKVNTCPNDRKTLNSNSLMAVPRLVLNLLNNMKIKCEYHESGCNVITTIAELTKHLDECEYKPEKNCKTCGLLIDVGEEHNCIANLVFKNNSITDEMNRLREKVLVLEAQQGMASILQSSRNHLNDFIILKMYDTINDKQKGVLVHKCKEAILNNDSFANISRSLSGDINNSPVFQGPRYWNVIAFSDEGGQSLVYAHQYFHIRFDKVHIEIFTAK